MMMMMIMMIMIIININTLVRLTSYTAQRRQYLDKSPFFFV